MLKIYGSAMSSGKRCIWFMEELGLPYEVIRLNMAEREHKNEAYLKLNPNGKVPTLVDDGFVVWESSAINTYLAEKYAPEWLGIGAEEHGLVAQWTIWTHSELHEAMEPLILQKFLQTPETEMTKAAPEKMKQRFDILEHHLEGRQFMVAERFTLADLNVASSVDLTGFIGFDMTAYPNISRWLAAAQARPAFMRMKATITPAA